jgi:predicted permease
MSVISRLAALWNHLTQRGQCERDLDEEIRGFIDLLVAEKIRAGFAPDEARRIAAIELGGVEQVKEHVRDAKSGALVDSVLKDVHYAIRGLLKSPGFAVTAILSLALGIGANTAIFSLWNGVLRTSLPGVDSPEDLVMLSDPGTSGMWRGGWNSRTDGPRAWISYVEFEQLRDYASGFSAMMASQASLNTWQSRVEGGPPEQTRGRLVSGAFFEVLGVRPAIGHLFTRAEDLGEPAYAVISYAYWQRRFGGRPDVLGRALTVRDTSVTIVGVTPAGFVGETSGQQPDLWLPLRLQSRVLPGSDWLHEQAPDKVMWLHVFGRLMPGVTDAQAEAQANAVFRANLESFYGATDNERRRELLDQRLRMTSGGRGASANRGELSSSLTMLLASVGVLLLITCANLANLLLARGAARANEIAVRVALGGSRARIIRQLVTESLALAAMGGVAAVAVANVMHSALVRMVQQAEPDFFVGFSFTTTVFAFVLAATLFAALLFGALPAWQVTGTNPGLALKESGRGTAGSAGELRSGRWLVGAQLALSLPLLVGAGLLARTAYNLQHPALGFKAERLLLARVDLSAVAQDTTRRDRILRELHERIRRIPGVEAASFSQLGLFSGGQSNAAIVVDDVPTGSRGRLSALDRVGTDYFTTLRIPILRGRDISENDRSDTNKVCVVNEAFVQRFFSKGDPMGRRVNTTDGSDVRTSYEIVGVVGDARTQSLRGEFEPRFFVPAEQRPSQSTSRTFVIRVGPDSAGVAAAVREMVNGVDIAVSVSEMTSIEEQMAPLSTQERTIARLAVVFAAVALMLAAIGLYGVLSYGIARRAREVAVRIALGAQSPTIIAMILRETVGSLVGGLLLGGALAYGTSRMIASRLYGVAPQDLFTLASATAVLLLVALVATYLPARRATKIDPMVALRCD